MKLYFSGHDCRYAAEQTLLMLFPGEKPEYPEGPPSGDRCELTVKRGGRYTVCSALLVRGGVGYPRPRPGGKFPASRASLRRWDTRTAS